MAHIHDRYDFTASAYIVHEKKVLLLMHKKLNMWLQPGGHIELDEDPEEALWREIQEETGLARNQLEIVEMVKARPVKHLGSKPLPIPFDLNVHQFGDTEHFHIDMCYLMRAKTNKLILNTAESHSLRWFSPRDLDDLGTELDEGVKAMSLFALGHVK